jgi:hypothetical protein
MRKAPEPRVGDCDNELPVDGLLSVPVPGKVKGGIVLTESWLGLPRLPILVLRTSSLLLRA